jgi:GWxTD domain-containing protein
MSQLLLLLVISAGNTTGDQPAFALNHAVFLASDSAVRIELSYEIPYTLLAFQRESSGYVARFSVRAQCWDAKKRLVASQDWDDEMHELNYDATMNTTARVTGLRTVLTPRARLAVEAVIQDRQSERIRSWSFNVAPPKFVSEMRLSRARRTRDSARDTLYVHLETYAGSEHKLSIPTANAGARPESVLVLVNKARKVWASERRPVMQDSWRSVQDLSFPLAGFENGVYEVKVTVTGAAGRALEERRATFEVANSIFGSERDFQERVKQMLWIATESEMQRLRVAAPPQRESLWNAFWKQKDVTPTTEENEAERTYFERIDYAERHFGHGDRGYRSDRARVYVKYGPPDNIESQPFEAGSNAYEVWYYYNQNLRFVFYDVGGFGEFKQTEPKQ